MAELEALLEQVNFNSASDQLWCVGDLVGRGPHSLAVLEFVDKLGPAFKCVLGNHDLHLLAVLCGIKSANLKDNVSEIVQSPNRDYWIDWLRHQPLFLTYPKGNLAMVHAGVYPGWSVSEAQTYADEISRQLKGNGFREVVSTMYGNEPSVWTPALRGNDRARFIINAFTRMRYCRRGSDGPVLNLTIKDAPEQVDNELLPWFDLRDESSTTIAFGHWASLGGVSSRSDIVALDTGCVWGNKLTLWDYENKYFYQQNAVTG